LITNFLYIFVKVILPIFLLASVGFAAQKLLKMDIRTFTRLNVYIFIPAVLFVKIYSSDVSLTFFGTLLGFILCIEIIMFLIGETVSRVFRYPRSIKKAFCNSLLFFNSGNYGLPLVDLAFRNNPIASASQVFIMLIQNITTNTFGVFQASSGNSTYHKALKNILQMPSLYVLAVAVIVKATGCEVPDPILVPMQYVSNGFIAIALLTLGVQLADIKVAFRFKDVLASSCIRLVLSPLIGYALVSLMGIHGILAQSLIVGVSTPTAVNTAILAKEFDNEPEYASQIVMVSTLLSAVTVSTVIYLVRGIA
jgi:malate permease and related proteins